MIDVWTFAAIAVVALASGVTAITFRAFELVELLDPECKDKWSVKAQARDLELASELEDQARDAEFLGRKKAAKQHWAAAKKARDRAAGKNK